MLEQLYTIWFQLFGSKWLKAGALIQQATPPLLELLLKFAPHPDNRHAISPMHLGLFLAKKQGVSTAGWRLEAKEVQRQLAYRLIDETIPHTGRALVRTKLDRIAHAFVPATQGQHAAPAPLEFDHSETPKAAMERAFSEANYALLAAVQARDVHAMQRAADQLRSLDEVASVLAASIRTNRSIAEKLSG